MKYYLRVYCNYKQNNWLKLLFIITFVYNNNMHFAINKTLNELLNKYVAIFDIKLKNKFLKKKTFLTIKRANWFQETRLHLINLWKNIVKQQAKYYNKQHKNKIYQLNNKVLLRNLNVRTLRLKKNWLLLIKFIQNNKKNLNLNLLIKFFEKV